MLHTKLISRILAVCITSIAAVAFAARVQHRVPQDDVGDEEYYDIDQDEEEREQEILDGENHESEPRHSQSVGIQTQVPGAKDAAVQTDDTFGDDDLVATEEIEIDNKDLNRLPKEELVSRIVYMKKRLEGMAALALRRKNELQSKQNRIDLLEQQRQDAFRFGSDVSQQLDLAKEEIQLLEAELATTNFRIESLEEQLQEAAQIAGANAEWSL